MRDRKKGKKREGSISSKNMFEKREGNPRQEGQAHQKNKKKAVQLKTVRP